MGIVIFGKNDSNKIQGTLSTISGDLHAKDTNTLIGAVALAEGEWTGDQNNLADITGNLTTLDGVFEGYSSANSIEGELATLTFEGIIATSNCVKLEGDLIYPDIQLYGGGAIDSELEPALISGELTGTVPTIGSMSLECPLIEGTLYCGAEFNLESVIITGDMTGTVPVVGNFNAESKLSILTGSFDAIVPFGADLVGDLAQPTGVWTAHTDTSGQIQGTLSTLTGNLHAQTESQGSLEGDLQILSGYLHAQHSAVGDIEGDLSVLIPTLGLTSGSYDYRILRFVRGETR